MAGQAAEDEAEGEDGHAATRWQAGGERHGGGPHPGLGLAAAEILRGQLADASETDAGGEDRVLARAGAEGTSALELARRYEAAFLADCAALNIHPASYSPRASESIPLMIEAIGKLIENGHAYRSADGSVFFDARSFPGYGEISGNRLDDLRPGRRTGGAVGERQTVAR